MTLDNIRKCCTVFNIQLYEFFLPEDTPVPDYVSLGVDEKTAEIIQLYKSLPKEQRVFLLEVMKTAIKELIAMGEKK